MSFFTRYGMRASMKCTLVKHDSPPRSEEHLVETEAHRRTVAEDSNRRSAGARAMSGEEFAHRKQVHRERVQRERAGIASGVARRKPDQVLAPQPPPALDDSGTLALSKADRPQRTPRLQSPRRQRVAQRVRKCSASATLDLGNWFDVATAIRLSRG